MPVDIATFKAAFKKDIDVNSTSPVEEALGMLQMHVKFVEDLDLAKVVYTLRELTSVSSGAKAAIAKVKDNTHKPVQSHIKVLEKKLEPLDRHIADIRRKDSSLPPGRDGVRGALVNGNLKAKLKDARFNQEVMDWLGTVKDPDEETKGELIAAFRASVDTALRQLVFEKAFNCKIKMKSNDVSSATIPAQALTKIVDTIELLPKGHLPKEWEFNAQDGHSISGGYWDEKNNIATVNYGLLDIPDFKQLNLYTESGDPLEGTKMFESVIKHELGHAVETRNTGTSLTFSTAGGDWKKHGDFKDVVPLLDAVVRSFATALKTALGMAKTPSTAVGDVVKSLSDDDMGDITTLKTRLVSGLLKKMGDDVPMFNTPPVKVSTHTGGGPPPPPTLDFGMDRKHKILQIEKIIPMTHKLIQILVQGARKDPSMKLGSNPIAHLGRVYVNGGADGWLSFARDTWDKKVSMYQYASPREWFAEFYVAANNENRGVRKKAQRAFPDAYKWFADNDLLVMGD